MLNDSTELLGLVRLRGSVPSVAPDWTAQVILEQATRELLSTHLPLLLAARGEYLVKKVEQALVSGTSRYRLPARACAIRMIDLVRLDRTVQPINESNPADDLAGVNSTLTGVPTRFTFEEHAIDLWPIPQAADTLRVKYHIRPSRICETTHAAQITAITPNTPAPGQTTVAFASTPTGAFWVAATRFDFVKATSPFDLLGLDLVPAIVGVNSRIFAASDIPVDLAVGDWITPAGYSPMPNIPVELHEPLALRTAAAIVKPKGDSLAERLTDEAAQKEKQLLVGILAPRSKGNVKRLVSRRWG